MTKTINRRARGLTVGSNLWEKGYLVSSRINDVMRHKHVTIMIVKNGKEVGLKTFCETNGDKVELA